MVYVLKFNDKNTRDSSLYTSPDDDDSNELVLLIGNTDEVKLLYSALVKTEQVTRSEMILKHVPSRQLEKITIKNIICIVSKSSKVEEFILQHKVEDSDCWPNDVVTVVWDNMTVPKLLKGTKHTNHTNDKWTSDVFDEINKTCAACKLLMQKLNCEATKQFWREIDNEGPNPDHSCHFKFFEKFLERLKDAFPKEEGLRSKSTINLLKFILNVDRKDPIAGIKLSDLTRVTDLFGPIKEQDDRCELIRQLHFLIKRSLKARDKDKRVKSSWFVGDMTREEAETCLLATDCKDKTYLVRISGTDGEDGDFALSVRHEDHCHHLKIQGNSKTALSESPYNAHLKFAGREFSSLPDVIDYVTHKQEIEMDTEDDSGDCSSVMCLRIFNKSPLNGAMSGYEKTK